MRPAAAVNGVDTIEAGSFCPDSLPYLQSEEQTHQFCTYDRAGDNHDAEYFQLYEDTNGECVIFDAMGPGCLYRQQMNIWYAAPAWKGIRIRYYFDNETKPRIDMDVSTYFSTNNPIFQPPLAFDGYDVKKKRDRFRTFYHPMFFKKRLKIALSAEPGGPANVLDPWTGRVGKPANGGDYHVHWYQFTYRLFGEDPGLESWTPEKGRRMMPELLSAWDVGGEHLRAVQDCKKTSVTRRIDVGKMSAIWKTRRAGTITALHFKLSPTNDVDALFHCWLKITFDGAAHPQVEAPLGCFFGVYRTVPKAWYDSLLLRWTNYDAYCYFPMPFWKSAEIQLENRCGEKVTLRADIDYKTGSAMPYPKETCGYFFASYHREDPRREGIDYTYLDVSNCSGQVVGHVAGRWHTCCEENERTYFDGSETPWIEGDGYEDDQGMGWGMSWGPPALALPSFGAPAGNVGQGGLYRFLLADRYSFSSGIKNGHQTYGPHSPWGEENRYRVGTEESVTFWYGHLSSGLIQTDELDPGNRQSEAAHAYRAEGDVQKVHGDWWYDGEFNNVLFKTPAIADDGVSFTNSSTFTVALSPDNQGVRLRRRSDKANDRQEARVFIDGQLVTERPWYSVDYETTFKNIRWFDSDFDIPAKYTRGKSKMTVRIEFVSSETGRWDEYHYWVYSFK
ncbi:MAG TPA: DUF2961 domain-containing protein [Verrucomicrobiae bacterium]|nr:DUF2961 domain-containing protein [Verrucomicrobiae bacterium]